MNYRRRILGTLYCVLVLAACSSDDGSGLDDGGGQPGGQPGDGGQGGAVEQMIVDNTDFDWTRTLVDRGTKPHIALRQGDPVIAYMLERIGDAGFVRVVQGSGGTLGGTAYPDPLHNGLH